LWAVSTAEKLAEKMELMKVDEMVCHLAGQTEYELVSLSVGTKVYKSGSKRAAWTACPRVAKKEPSMAY